jgi:hypothetical protein
MLPLLPPYVINDLAHEHLEGRLPDGRPRRRHDAARFDESADLQPDPVAMGIRVLMTSGPIGRVVQWFERRAEAREDRKVRRDREVHAVYQRIDAALMQAERSTIEPLPAPTGDAPDEERTAA